MSQDENLTAHPFATTRLRLMEMQAALGGTQVDLITLAKAYAALANALFDDVQRTGQSSMRFEAVCKALDLRTAKSELLAFVRRDS